MNSEPTKVLIIGGSSIDKTSLIKHLSISDIVVIDGPERNQFQKLENISMEDTVAPYPYPEHREGFCPGCGKFLYDSKTVMSNVNYCSDCATATISSTVEIKRYLPPKKPKKKRMSRIQKQAMWGGGR